jgi:serine/threonine-protein kinase
MPPEMSLTDSVDARADIYALGCVGYFLLSGRLVFDATSAIQMIAMHIRHDPVPPSMRANVQVPQALESVILKCLAKRPEDRFQNVIDLSMALDAARVPAWTETDSKAFWNERQPVTAGSLPAPSDRAAPAPI